MASLGISFALILPFLLPNIVVCAVARLTGSFVLAIRSSYPVTAWAMYTLATLL